MAVVRFHCPFAGLSGCHDGSGNGLTKTYLITHLWDRHCRGEVQAITKHSILSDLVVFERDKLTLKRIGIWLCGVCFKTHTLRTKCHHGSTFVPPPDNGDGDVHFVLYDLIKPHVPSCGSLDLVRETLAEFASPMLDFDEKDLDLMRVLSSSGVAPYNDVTLKDLKAKHPFQSVPSLPDIPIDHHQLIASQDLVMDRIKSFHRDTSCGRDGLRAQHLMDCLSGAAVSISDKLVSSITQVVNLFLDGKCPMSLGEYIASAPLTPLVELGGGIRPIAVGTVWRGLVSKVSAIMVVHSLGGYLDDLQFDVGVSGGGEAILHAVNHLVEDRGDKVGLSMLLVDFQNAFNLVDRKVLLEEVRLRCPAISRWVEFYYSSPARLYYGEHTLWSCQGVQQGDYFSPLLFSLVLHPLICKIRDSFSLCLQAWYLDDGTVVEDTLVVGKVLELIAKDGPRCGLHLNVDKTEIFWPKEDPRSRVGGVFPPNISRPLHGVKLLGGAIGVDFRFSSELVMKRVAKTIALMDAVAKINDP
ncbi:putative reverse transcriptase domain-containing protein [Tanacetum coccineum]